MPLKKSTVYIDGFYLPCSAEAASALTPGAHPWHGVFETLRAREGKIEFLQEHLQRLLRGLKILKIRHPYTLAGLKGIARGIVKKNPLIKDGRLRLLVFQHGRQVHCAGMLLPFKPPSFQKYRRGLRVLIVKTSHSASRRRAEVKSLDYGLFARAYQQALAQGYDDALLVNSKGHVFESTRANIFIFQNGTLMTPPLTSGCLNGIIRTKILHTARRLRIPVLEQNLTPAMVRRARGAFLTNSMMGIMPLAKL